MPRVSKVMQLSQQEREWFDQELIRRGFADYQGFVAAAAERGIDISVSSAHRYGQSFRDRLERIRVVTDQARAVVAESPDDEGAVNEALMRLVQEKLFDMMQTIEFGKDDMSLSQVARAIADLGRASVSQKRLAADARKQALEEAAATAEQTGRAQGLSDDGVKALREAIMESLA